MCRDQSDIRCDEVGDLELDENKNNRVQQARKGTKRQSRKQKRLGNLCMDMSPKNAMQTV